MYLTSALALLFYGSALLTLPISGAATTDGFTIPANITEGHLYAVTIDPTTGEELHTRLDSLLPGPEPEPLARRHHEKRGANAAAAAAGRRDHPPRAYTFCGDGYVQASDLLDNAIHTFTDRCDRSNAVFLKDTLAVYAAHGTAVAYMCNFSTHGNPCRSMELLDALSLIGARCKWSQGGVLQSGKFCSISKLFCFLCLFVRDKSVNARVCEEYGISPRWVELRYRRLTVFDIHHLEFHPPPPSFCLVLCFWPHVLRSLANVWNIYLCPYRRGPTQGLEKGVRIYP